MSDTPISKVKVRAHLKKNWKKGGGCSVCGENSWEVQPEEFFLPNAEMSKRFSVSPVICTSCGNTLLISSAIVRSQFESRRGK